MSAAKNQAIISFEEQQEGWMSVKEMDLTANSLQALLGNEIPMIRIKGFASFAECSALVHCIEAHGFEDYQSVNPPIGRIGITQFEAQKHGKDWYFERAAKSRLRLEEMMSAAGLPMLERLIGALSATGLGDAAIAHEEAFGTYFAGLIRRINASALIHADFAPLESPDWQIGKIEQQLAWNLYLRTPDIGGECFVYNRPWERGDEAYRLQGSYGYAPELMRDAECKVIKPVVGDLVIFNSRNFHEVALGLGDRLTMSSFIGRRLDGRFLLWS